MPRFPLAIRRLLAVAGTAFVGAAAAVAVSAPANAAPAPETYGTGKCFSHTFDKGEGRYDGKWIATVKWHDNRGCDDKKLSVALLAYTAPSKAFATPQYLYDKDEAEVSKRNWFVKLKVAIPACFYQIDLVTAGEIYNPLEEQRYGDRKLGSERGPGSVSKGPRAWVNAGDDTCIKPKAAMKSHCDGSVEVWLYYPKPGNGPIVLTVHHGQQKIEKTLQAGAAPTKVTIPGVTGTVTVKYGDTVVKEGTWRDPGKCAPPVLTSSLDCKYLSVTVKNPADGVPTKVTLTSNKGEPVIVELARNSEKVVKFDGVEGLTVTSTVGETDYTFSWVKPGTCDGGLPVTGVDATTMTGLSVGLVAVGAGLFYVFRRRRIRFQAV